VKALRAKDVIAACADWCDLEVSRVLGTRSLDARAVRSRRLAALVLLSDGRSPTDTAEVLGYVDRRSVAQHLRDATEEDRFDAKRIEADLREAMA
jgi:hypothetical protein